MVYRDLPKADKALIWIAACQMLIGATCLGFGIWFLSDNYTGDEIKKMFWFWWGIVTYALSASFGGLWLACGFEVASMYSPEVFSRKLRILRAIASTVILVLGIVEWGGSQFPTFVNAINAKLKHDKTVNWRIIYCWSTTLVLLCLDFAQLRLQLLYLWHRRNYASFRDPVPPELELEPWSQGPIRALGRIGSTVWQLDHDGNQFNYTRVDAIDEDVDSQHGHSSHEA